MGVLTSHTCSSLLAWSLLLEFVLKLETEAVCTVVCSSYTLHKHALNVAVYSKSSSDALARLQRP